MPTLGITTFFREVCVVEPGWNFIGAWNLAMGVILFTLLEEGLRLPRLTIIGSLILMFSLLGCFIYLFIFLFTILILAPFSWSPSSTSLFSNELPLWSSDLSSFTPSSFKKLSRSNSLGLSLR